MKLRGGQLAGYLARELAPIYLISGDEPLQVAEATDVVRSAARERGYTGREVLNVERSFDWSGLASTASELSLFAEQRLIELRLPGGKPGDAGGKALRAWAGNPPDDCVLLIISAKIDASAQRSKWFQALEKSGVVVQLWPPRPDELPGWIRQRMQARGMQASPEAIALLAERVEGNLLAAAQEIDKLHLLYGGKSLDLLEIVTAVADSARFNIYELVDTALSGDVPRTARTLRGLQGEGIEPVLVLWALAREIRLLEGIALELESGSPLDQALRQNRIWEQRKPVVRQGLQRHNCLSWQQMLRRAAHIDRVIKGIGKGNPWDELLQLVLLIAGTRLFKGVASPHFSPGGPGI